MRTELHAFVCDLAKLREAVDLEAAGVGEQAAWPADEFVQAAHAADRFVAGTEIEMVGVAENDLCAEGFEDILHDGLDGARSADRHEDWGFDDLMGEMQSSAPSAVCGGLQKIEREGHRPILMGAVLTRSGRAVRPHPSHQRRAKDGCTAQRDLPNAVVLGVIDAARK